MRQYFIVLLMLLVAGCRFFARDSGEEVVAKVGKKEFTRAEIAAMIPKGVPQNDSAARAMDIIQFWVRQELMLAMAEENLNAEEKDVERELEEYRKSLIIHHYQQQLISQKMDTVITGNDIKQFYELHPENFILEQSIVKAVFVEVPRRVAKPEQIKRWMISRDDKAKGDLESYSFQYATKYDYFNNEWVEFARLKARIPDFYQDAEDFLRRQLYYETSDGDNYYFLFVNDFRLVGEKAPYDFVKDRIESLILNNRKMEFIQQLEKDIYQKGKDDNKFEIIDFKPEH
jgi:hypothetical protein